MICNFKKIPIHVMNHIEILKILKGLILQERLLQMMTILK